MGLTKAERQARQEEIDKDREANAAERRKRAHERFITNHMPGTTMMFAAKLVRDSYGRRLAWNQCKYLMWSQDYDVTKKFVDQETRARHPKGCNPMYGPFEVERVFLAKFAGQWHRVYANRFVLGDLDVAELQPPREPMSYDADEMVNERLECICPPNDEHGGLCHKDCPIHGVKSWAPTPPLFAPTLENGGVVCKGSFMLGSACGKCVRCEAERANINEALNDAQRGNP